MMEIDPVEAKVSKLSEAVAVPVKSEDMSPGRIGICEPRAGSPIRPDSAREHGESELVGVGYTGRTGCSDSDG